MSQILALDLGNRRIGLALSNSETGIALPLFTLHRSTDRADLKSIARVIRKHAVTEVVVGLPLHASGDVSAQAAKSVAFAQSLREQHPAMEVHLLDERLTTVEAHGLLDESGSSRRTKADRKQRTAIIDQLSAVLLLESFLSISAPRLLPPPSE